MHTVYVQIFVAYDLTRGLIFKIFGMQKIFTAYHRGNTVMICNIYNYTVLSSTLVTEAFG